MDTKYGSIEKLEKIRKLGSVRFNFNTQLDPNKIKAFEIANGIVLPLSYGQFLTSFNGGMFLEYDPSYYIDMTEWEPDGPKWSSYYFFTFEELIEEYSNLKVNCKLISNEISENFPIIPICNTPKQETIMLVSHLGLNGESPVFISSDISDMSTYLQIDTSFDSFLNKIIENEGFPDIKVAPGSQYMSVFIYESGIHKAIRKEETDEDIIERTTAIISLDSNDSWAYCDRGNAYENLGQRELALSDFNQAIKLDPEESFFYYCRGIIQLDFGSKRKALIDLDIAVKLDPENLLFLTGRADALQKLGKLEKALIDCNKVLDIDYTYKLALYVRWRVYKAMGKINLAQIDSDTIDELG